MEKPKLTKRKLLEPAKTGSWAVQYLIDESNLSGKVIPGWKMEPWLREELTRQRTLKGRVIEPIIKYYSKGGGYKTPYYYYMKRDIKKVEAYLTYVKEERKLKRKKDEV